MRTTVRTEVTVLKITFFTRRSRRWTKEPTETTRSSRTITRTLRTLRTLRTRKHHKQIFSTRRLARRRHRHTFTGRTNQSRRSPGGPNARRVEQIHWRTFTIFGTIHPRRHVTTFIRATKEERHATTVLIVWHAIRTKIAICTRRWRRLRTETKQTT